MAKQNIVGLDGWIKPPPLDFSYDLTLHEKTFPDEVIPRLQNATIALTAAIKINRAAMEALPNLALINCSGTGTNHIDTDAARELGITICHVPAQNTDSVAEHAFALYYAARRRVVEMHQLAVSGIWARDGVGKYLPKPPRTNSEETLVVIGYGALGKKVESIAKALGMRVLIAERKGASQVREGRIEFSQALKLGTVFIITAPLDASTRDMIAAAELATMDSTALIVNVGRGGVINEADLAQALRDGRLGGAATDVFETEPASRETSPLLEEGVPNLIVSPHIAWYSKKTIEGTIATVKANLEAFVRGRPRNVVVAGTRGLE